MRILNVGCGEDIYGTDRIDGVKRKNVTKVANISKRLPYPNNTFNEVYTKNLFEHLENPNLFLLECRRVLKKGGKLRIITDNAGWVFFHHNPSGWVHGDYSYDGKFRKEDMHFALYTKEHLRNHFAKAGLKINKQEYMFMDYPRTYWKFYVQLTIRILFGKRMGMPRLYIEGGK